MDLQLASMLDGVYNECVRTSAAVNAIDGESDAMRERWKQPEQVLAH